VVGKKYRGGGEKMAYTWKQYLAGAGLGLTFAAIGTLSYAINGEYHGNRVVETGKARIMSEDVRYVVQESGILKRRSVLWCKEDNTDCVQSDIYLEDKVEAQIDGAEAEILKK